MDAHILLSPVGQKTETRFNCLLTENRKSTEMVGTPSTVCGLLPPLRRGTRSARPRGLGGDFEFLPLKSPRNPITPIETSRVSTLHPGLYKNLREGARRVIGATAKPLYPIDGKAAGFDRRNPSQSPAGVETSSFHFPCMELFVLCGTNDLTIRFELCFLNDIRLVPR